MAIQKQKHRFIGMNQDDDNRDIPVGDYRYGLNIRVGSSEGSNLGVVENIKGNSLIQFVLPFGNNKVIGTLENRNSNSIFYWIFNDNGANGIYRYFVLTNSVVKIMNWSGFGWNENTLITGARFLENSLAWVDPIPREINIADTIIRQSIPGWIDEPFDFSYVKVPPTFPLVIESFTDTVTLPIDTELDKNTYTFAYDYIYRDGQQSVFSPMSRSISSAYLQVLAKDTITLNVDPSRILKVLDVGKERYNKFISYVNFYFRDSPTGPFKRFKRMKVQDITSNATLGIPIALTFKNNETYPVVDTKQSSRLNDAVPLQATSLELSNNRDFFGGVTEGFQEANPQVGNVSMGWKVIEPKNYSQVPDVLYDHIAYGDYFAWKNFSKYQLGIEYFDEADRDDGVYPFPELAFQVPPDWRNIQGAKDKIGEKYWTVNFKITSPPPSWAKSYQIVRTENLSVQSFIQGIINDTVYIKSIDSNGTPNIIRKKIGETGVFDAAGGFHTDFFHDGGIGADSNYKFITYNSLTSGDWTGAENVARSSFGRNIYEGGVNVNGEPLVARRDDRPFGASAQGGAASVNIVQSSPIGKDSAGNPIYYGGVSQIGGPPVTNFYTDGLDQATIVWLDIYNWYNTTTIRDASAQSNSVASFKLQGLDTPLVDGWSIDELYISGTKNFLPHSFKYTLTPSGTGEYSDYGVLFSDLITALNSSTEATTPDGKYVFRGDYLPTGKLVINVAAPGQNPQNYNSKVITIVGGLFDSSVAFSGGFGTSQRTNPSNNTPYIFTKGDKVNIYYKPDGKWIGRLDIEILDFIQNRYISIPYIPDFVTQDKVLGVGIYIEVFTPRKKDQAALYFEMGECYPIVNGQHSKTDFSLWRGDTHKLRGARMYATNMDINQSVSTDPQKFDVYAMNPDYTHRAGQGDNIWERGNGRPNAELLVRKQQLRGSDIIFTDPYIQDSLVNGLCTIRAENRYTMPHEFGMITKLINAADIQNENTVMLSVHENDTATLYLGQAMIKDGNGTETLASTTSVIGAMRPLKAGYGSINPESVKQHNGVVYAWDCKKGVAWRYAQDGQTPISGDSQSFAAGKLKNYFYKKSRALLSIPNQRAFGLFDPYHNEYGVCFSDGECLSFSENLKRWTTFYNFYPEGFEKANTRMVSFKNGQLWLHNENSLYNNFYGQQYTSKIEVISNDFPSNVKIFCNYAIEGTTPWIAIKIANPEGQESNLILQDYEKEDNVFYALIMRDINTPGVQAPKVPIIHGDYVASQTLESTFENISDKKELLFAIDVGYTVAKGHRV